MNINSYVKTLKGSVSKDEVLTTLEGVSQDLSTKTLPILNSAAAAFKTYKPKTAEMGEFENRYRGEFRLGKGASVFSDLLERMNQVAKNLDFIRHSVEKTLPDAVAANAIDYRSAVLMQLIDNASFLNRYVRRFTELAVICETDASGMYEEYKKDNLNKGEILWVSSRFPSFLSTLAALSDNSATFKKKFDEIPNVKVDADGDSDVSLFGRGRMDPFRLGFIPVFLNPFFIVGKWVAEFQAWRYKEAQEDLSRIQKRILLLEESIEGRSMPKIEAELKLLRNKSEELTYKINEAEADL